jgi:hypothetical protein
LGSNRLIDNVFRGKAVILMIFVGDDWAEEHHDVYLMDEGGKRLTSRRLPEGLVGIRQLHELIAQHVEDPDQVVIGIETSRRAKNVLSWPATYATAASMTPSTNGPSARSPPVPAPERSTTSTAPPTTPTTKPYARWVTAWSALLPLAERRRLGVREGIGPD